MPTSRTPDRQIYKLSAVTDNHWKQDKKLCKYFLEACSEINMNFMFFPDTAHFQRALYASFVLPYTQA